MGDLHQPNIIIKPQVQSDTASSVPAIDQEAEKKRRIDEALALYDASRTPGATAPPPTPHAQPSETAAAAPVPHPAKSDSHSPEEPHKTEEQFIMEHAAEVLAIVKPKREPSKAPDSMQKTVAPTQIDPEASIAAAAALAEEQKKTEEAAKKAAQSGVHARYAHAAERPLQLVDKQDHKKYAQLIVAWAVAIPLAILLAKIELAVWDGGAIGIIGGVLTLAEYLLGLYGALGWIPLVVFYIRKHKDWV